MEDIVYLSQAGAQEAAADVSGLQLVMGSSLFQIITVIVMAVLGYLIIGNLARLLKMGLLASHLDNALVHFVTTIIRFIMLLLLAMYCLHYLGLPLTGLVSAISALTLAIGLAVKEILASVANGIMLVSTAPFKENDYVEIGGTGGTVREVSLMHTILYTPDNKRIMIPNSQVFSSSIVNYSSSEFRRMDIGVDVDYDEDPEKVRSILMDIVNNHPLVCKEPAPSCHYNYSKDSSIAFNVRVWAKSSDYWTVNWDLNELLTRTLIEKGINIPFPQVTVSYRKDQEAAR